MNLLDILRDMIKGKPILFLLIFFFIGCLLGWWVMGYIVWPVQYAGEAHSYDLTAPEKERYIVMVADSYKMTGDSVEAKKQFADWNSSELGLLLANVSANLRVQGQTEQAQRVEDLASLLVAGTVAPLPTQDTETPPSAQQEIPAQSIAQSGGFPLMSIIQICIGLVVILIVIAAILFVVDLRRRGPRPEKPRFDAHIIIADAEKDETAIGHFRSRYSLGDDNYDESFSLETEEGEFLGECGVGISEMLESGPPDKVTAFEVWLFDKSDIRTVTKVLMSEFAFNEPSLRDKLAPKGDALLAQEGMTFAIETETFDMEVRVTEVSYGTEGEYPHSYFETLAVELIGRAHDNTA